MHAHFTSIERACKDTTKKPRKCLEIKVIFVPTLIQIRTELPPSIFLASRMIWSSPWVFWQLLHPLIDIIVDFICVTRPRKA